MSTLLEPLIRVDSSANYGALKLSAPTQASDHFNTGCIRDLVCSFLTNENSLLHISHAFHAAHEQAQDKYYKRVFKELSSKKYFHPFLPENFETIPSDLQKKGVLATYKFLADWMKIESSETFRALQGKNPLPADVNDLFVQLITRRPPRTIEEVRAKAKASAAHSLATSPRCINDRKKTWRLQLGTSFIAFTILGGILLGVIAAFATLTWPVILVMLLCTSLIALCVSLVQYTNYLEKEKIKAERSWRESHSAMTELVDLARQETSLFKNLSQILHDDELIDIAFSNADLVAFLRKEIDGTMEPAVTPPELSAAEQAALVEGEEVD